MSMHEEEDDRPSVRRIPASGVHVAIELGRGTEHFLWSDLTLDVAKGGVFVATFHPLVVGTAVHLLLTLEGDDVPIATSGVVRFCQPHRDGSDGAAGAGIAFDDLDAEQAQKLERFAREVREPMLFELDEPARSPSAAAL